MEKPQVRWRKLPLGALFERRDNENQMDARITKRLHSSLDAFGLVRNLLVMQAKKGDTGRYMVLDGNQRLQALKEKYGDEHKVTCCIVSWLPKAERVLITQAMNRIHGSDNKEKLSEALELLTGKVALEDIDSILGHRAITQRAIREAEDRADQALSAAKRITDIGNGDAEPPAGGADLSESQPVREITKVKPNRAYCSKMEDLSWSVHSFDSIVTDPPYMINTFENDWDRGENLLAFTKGWLNHILPALKPGGMVAVFINSRQYDFIVRAMRECDLTVRDPLVWIRYCSKIAGKRLNANGTAYTTLKNCVELIAVGQKKPEGTYTENYRRFGIGGFFFDKNILPFVDDADEKSALAAGDQFVELARSGKLGGRGYRTLQGASVKATFLDGRRPSNVVVLPDDAGVLPECYQRFFVVPAVRNNSKEAVKHENQKPLRLLEWIVPLLTPKKGIVYDPFGGSGTTAVAALRTGRKFVTSEKSSKYFKLLKKRVREEVKKGE